MHSKHSEQNTKPALANTKYYYLIRYAFYNPSVRKQSRPYSWDSCTSHRQYQLELLCSNLCYCHTSFYVIAIK